MFKFLLTFFSAGPEDSNRLSEAPQLARETGVVCPPDCSAPSPPTRRRGSVAEGR